MPPPVRFGICGATGGGKTTYLTALNIAVRSANGALGTWRMVPGNDDSRLFLVDHTEQLIIDRTFPVATQKAERLRFFIYRDEENHHRHLLPRLNRHRHPVSFTLEVEDLPGEQFRLDRGTTGIPMSQDSLDRLIDAHALIFLFDPIRELNRQPGQPSNWQFLHNLLQTMTMRLANAGRLDHGRLRQHVVVCVTKFDEPSIFKQAYAYRFVDVDEDGRPRVPSDRAEAFFDWICSWADGGRADGSSAQFRDMIHAAAGAVHYYATSSVGFWTPPGGHFDPNDFQNVDIVAGQARLRGPVRPVNVLEPLVELEVQLRREGVR